MAHRGRGKLEIKPSSNPFFQTTGADIGIDPHRQVKWTGDLDPAMLKSHSASQDTFSFLYTRESDTIGGKVPKPVLEKKELLTKTEFLKQRREMLKNEMGDTFDYGNEAEQTTKFKKTAEEVLASYHHVTKVEDPRFITTSNDYGKKAPTIATFVLEREAKKQTFSKSFTSKPSNSSMNCGITRSTVHPKLDPQFL